MDKIEQIKNVKISLGEDSYDILIGNDLFSNISKEVKKALGKDNPKKSDKIFVISDENVAALYSKTITEALMSAGFYVTNIILKAGESTKSFDNYRRVLTEILAEKPERNSTLIALGGGVIGDLTGFVASTLLRGVNFIQIPTSLLAMVDSSVGGKTGINCEFGKNLIGAFYQPKLVVINLDVINSLPEREILAGYAEIIKYGLIDDAEFFDYLISKESDEIIDNLQYMVEKSCISKANIVSADEKEKGQRALLNLGHTFGHALEAIANYDGSLLHGEAVAIGMILAYRFSEFLGFCPKGRANKIESHFIKKGMKTKISQLKKKVSADQMIDLMKGDKKVSDGKMVFIMAKDIGKCYIDRDIKEASLKSFLEDEINR